MREFVCLAALFALTAGAAFAGPADPKTIEVNGYAEMQVKPDRATVDIGVITSDKITANALQANNVEMQRVVAAIKALGIPDEAMRTSKFSINGIHPPVKGEYGGEDFSITLGYEVANKISVTVSDFGKIPAIIDAAVKAGANSSNSVSFDVKDRKAYDDKMLAAAVADARHDATVMASAENSQDWTDDFDERCFGVRACVCEPACTSIRRGDITGWDANSSRGDFDKRPSHSDLRRRIAAQARKTSLESHGSK